MSGEKFILCADGGGSKLQALLFDRQFRLHAAGKSGPINGSYSKENILAQIQTTVAECTQNIPPESIQKAILSAPGMNDAIDLFFEEVQRHSPAADCQFISEGKACLLAGSLQQEGIVALSGTGSGIFWIDGKKEYHLGGWGYLLADFGSGFLIGQRGIQAAIRGYEGWGESTLLIDMACEEYGASQLWDILQPIYLQSFPVKRIAAFCRLVGQAADLGDHAAIDVLRTAAREIAGQAASLLRKHPSKKADVVVSGGSWKCSPLLYTFFAEELHRDFPDIKVQMPLFDPVMGGVILTLQERFPTDFKRYIPTLQKEFQSFLFQPSSHV